jgi:hypothetical protein
MSAKTIIVAGALALPNLLPDCGIPANSDVTALTPLSPPGPAAAGAPAVVDAVVGPLPPPELTAMTTATATIATATIAPTRNSLRLARACAVTSVTSWILA